MRMLLLSILIALCGELIAAPGPVRSPSDLFREANQAFMRGDSKRAERLLRIILRSYPTNEPSLLMLGRIFYSQGRIGQAAKLFRRVPLQAVPPSMFYDYGITMFASGDCQAARAALEKVSQASRYRYLASFYLGVCYNRERELQRAVFYLRKAERLPSHLRDTRRRLLEDIEGQLATRSQGFAAPVYAYTYVPLPPPTYNTPQIYQAPQPGTVAKKPEPPPPVATGFNVSVTPTFSFERYAARIKHKKDSAKDGSLAMDINTLKLGAEAQYLFSPWSAGQPVAKLPFEVVRKGIAVQKEHSRVVNVELISEDETGKESSITTTGKDAISFKASPSMKVPIVSWLSATGLYEQSAELPNGETKNQSGSQLFQGSAVATIDFLSVDGLYEMRNSTNASGQLTKYETRYKAGAKLDFSSYKLTASYDNRDSFPPGPGFETPDPKTDSKISGSFTKIGESYNLGLVVRMRTRISPPKAIPKETQRDDLYYGVQGNLSLPFKSTAYSSYYIEDTTGRIVTYETGEGEEKKTVGGQVNQSETRFVIGVETAPISWVTLGLSYYSEAVTPPKGKDPLATEKAQKDYTTLDYIFFALTFSKSF